MASMLVSSGSGVFSGSTATSSSAGLFNRAFLLGLGLALRKINRRISIVYQNSNIKDNNKCIAHPRTVLRGGSFVADDSPEDE